MERKTVTIDDVIRRLSVEGNEKWYEWVRQMLTLSSSGLVLLVSLHENYVPDDPTFLWLLRTSWGALALTISFAAIILFGEHDAHFRAANRLLYTLHTQGQLAAAELVHRCERPRRIYVVARHLLPISLATSMISLTIFALLNL